MMYNNFDGDEDTTPTTPTEDTGATMPETGAEEAPVEEAPVEEDSQA